MKPTHIIEFTDGHTALFGPAVDYDMLTSPLTVLDGGELNHVILSRLAHPAWSDELTEAGMKDTWKTFLQAGGSASAMTLELRTKTETGEYKQFIVGRPISGLLGADDVPIRVGNYTYRVHPNEVFDAEQAARAMIYYFEHDTVPPKWTLRELVRTVS